MNDSNVAPAGEPAVADGASIDSVTAETITMNGGSVGQATVRAVMDAQPLTCAPETDIDELRRMMLTRHARYTPVMSANMLMGVISFYDVARAVVEGQDFENRMLKAYIRDWPVEEQAEHKATPN